MPVGHWRLTATCRCPVSTQRHRPVHAVISPFNSYQEGATPIAVAALSARYFWTTLRLRRPRSAKAASGVTNGNSMHWKLGQRSCTSNTIVSALFSLLPTSTLDELDEATEPSRSQLLGGEWKAANKGTFSGTAKTEAAEMFLQVAWHMLVVALRDRFEKRASRCLPCSLLVQPYAVLERQCFCGWRRTLWAWREPEELPTVERGLVHTPWAPRGGKGR